MRRAPGRPLVGRRGGGLHQDGTAGVRPVAGRARGVAVILRGILMLTMMVGLVAALHDYLGVRLVSDPGLAQPWAGLGWSVLWLGFASIPAAMACGPRGRSRCCTGAA